MVLRVSREKAPRRAFEALDQGEPTLRKWGALVDLLLTWPPYAQAGQMTSGSDRYFYFFFQQA